MILLSTVEYSFTVSGRVLVPASLNNPDVRVRNGAAIQLRNPNGVAIDTRIVSVELVKGLSGCRIALLLTNEIAGEDAIPGTEIWVHDLH